MAGSVTMDAGTGIPSVSRAGVSPRGALAGLSLSGLLASLGTSIASGALPNLADAFAAPFQQVQWVVIAFLLAVTSLMVGVGRLGDLTGRRRLLLAGIGLFTAAAAASAMAPALPVLIGARAVQGLGAAVMMALTTAFVADTVSPSQTGRALGLLGTTSAIGTALGPSLGGGLIALFGWRAIFLVQVPVGLLALYLVRRHLPADRRRSAARTVSFDGFGMALLAASLGAYALAMTVGLARGAGSVALLLLVAVTGLGLFRLVERRVAEPLLRLDHFGDPGLRASLLASALVATVVMATQVVGPFYLARGLGLTPAVVGAALSIGPLVAALTGVPAGRLVDRFGALHTTRAGLLGVGGGAVLLALLPPAYGLVGYLVPTALLTAGYATFQTANNTAVMRDAAADRRGVFSAMLNLSRYLGLISGAAVMGAVFAQALGGVDVAVAAPASVGNAMRVVFGVAAGLVGGALIVVDRPARRRDHSKPLVIPGPVTPYSTRQPLPEEAE